jgi:enoyl-CoA hydratase/carnithine racemase
MVSPDEAKESGLVRSVHAPEDLLSAARAIASEIAINSAPVSVAMSRQMLWRMLGASHPMEAHRAESRGIMLRGSSADAREGVNSFLEKRAANFTMYVSTDMPDIFPEWQDPEFK